MPTEDIDEAALINFITLRDGNLVCGTAAVEPRGGCGLLRSIAVAPQLRGGGHGRRLTEAAEKLASKRALSPLFLLTITAADFFRKRGFREVQRDAVPLAVQRSREFSALCPASAVVMAKP